MKEDLHNNQNKKIKIHIYPFRNEWMVIDSLNDAIKKTFSTANEALNFSRSVFEHSGQEHEIVIHSKYDNQPHFRLTL